MFYLVRSCFFSRVFWEGNVMIHVGAQYELQIDLRKTKTPRFVGDKKHCVLTL